MIRHPPPLPPQSRGLNAHLTIVPSRLLSNRIKANTALWADEEFAQRRRIIYRQKDGENVYGISNRYDLESHGRRLRPWKIQSLRTRVDTQRGRWKEGGRERGADNVFSYAQLLSSYPRLVPSSHPLLTNSITFWLRDDDASLCTENWNIHKSSIYHSQTEKRDANNSDIPVVDYGWGDLDRK